MKRNMDLIRELLLRLESFPKSPGDVVHIYPLEPELAVEGYSMDEVEYNLSLIEEAGFLEDLGPGSHPMEGIIFRRLSWAGHDFLDAARNNSVWAETKRVVAEKGGSVSFDLFKMLLMEVAKRALFG